MHARCYEIECLRRPDRADVIVDIVEGTCQKGVRQTWNVVYIYIQKEYFEECCSSHFVPRGFLIGFCPNWGMLVDQNGHVDG